MPTTYFIGDTHFGHENIWKFQPEQRPFASTEEHDEELIRRWNSEVKDADTVYVMGDFAFNTRLPIAGRLQGKKRLVLGNHDTKPTADYMLYFERLYGMFGYKEFLLSHMPVHPSQFERWEYNIHGHLHSNTLDDPRYINVSAEQINLTPISIDEIRNRLK